MIAPREYHFICRDCGAANIHGGPKCHICGAAAPADKINPAEPISAIPEAEPSAEPYVMELVGWPERRVSTPLHQSTPMIVLGVIVVVFGTIQAAPGVSLPFALICALVIGLLSMWSVRNGRARKASWAEEIVGVIGTLAMVIMALVIACGVACYALCFLSGMR